MRSIEHYIQVNCVAWFRLAHPELAPLLFAVPNGGRRDAVTGARLRAEGVTAGVADLILLAPSADGRHNALAIEMKTARGRQSEAQKAWQQAAESVGVCYAVCRCFDDFVETVETYIKWKN